jgi:hypothetical protein
MAGTTSQQIVYKQKKSILEMKFDDDISLPHGNATYYTVWQVL